MARVKDKDSKGSKRKTKNHIQGNPHKAISWFLYKSEGSEMIYSKSERENLAT